MNGPKLHQLFLAGLLTLSFGTGACGSDGVGPEGALVGGSCQVANDCEDECLTGGDFPEGTCSLSCSSDDDCPDSSHCIDKEGGVCLMACELPSDCRGGYTCKGKDNKGHGGESLVCIDD